MKIRRIQVEEGFLHRLDISFKDGLNVIIGPRGSGKTSIIELIRYCLGVDAYTSKIQERSRTHALSILESGQVILTMDAGGGEFIVTRSAEGRTVPPGFDFEPPLILSQGEIESIGLHEEGKLRLIDSLTSKPTKVRLSEKSILSEIRSISAQIRSLSIELQDIDDEIDGLKGIELELQSAKKEQEDLTGAIEAMRPQQSELTELSIRTTELSVQQDLFSRTIDSLRLWIDDIEDLILRSPRIAVWPDSAGEKDLLLEIRIDHQQMVSTLGNLISKINESTDQIKLHMEAATNEKIELESEARELRVRIDGIKEGAGLISRTVAILQEKAGQLEALINLHSEKAKQISALKKSRGTRLNHLESLREDRFVERSSKVETLNNVLRPAISLKMMRAAQLTDYESAIIETLRGSGLKYSTLAPLLAHSMSPRELAEAIENSDTEAISSLADIAIERAQRVITFAQRSSIDQIFTSFVEDGVRMNLLVGNDYQPSERLSTGQRCTVILPILLSNHGRPLIVDQPEDNLDNAYIVDTVIKSIKESSGSSQIICATHNPNIPVLGEANLVISLDSDGKRGFVRNANELDHPSTIEAITSVMEGGKEAFQMRAKFYSSSGAING